MGEVQRGGATENHNAGRARAGDRPLVRDARAPVLRLGSVLVWVLTGVESGYEVTDPGQSPRAQVLYLLRAQAVVDEVLIVPPLGADEAVVQVVEAELEAGVATAEAFQVDGGAMPGGGVDVERARIRSEKGLRWGGGPTKAA